MELVPIVSIDDITDPAIRERVLQNSKSKHYLAKEKGYEIGLLSIDIYPSVNYLVLYEILVPKHLRHKGIGSRLLIRAEGLARNFKRELIVLNPSPFENDYPIKKLVRWYKKHGYKNRDDSSGSLEKSVVDIFNAQ